MSERIRQNMLIILFLLTLCGSHFIWLVVGKYLDNENYENRASVEAPVLSWDTIEDYPMAFENYYNDHLPFRNQLIHMNSRIEYELLQTSPNRFVIKGKDGWLFYNSEIDGNPMLCYKGIDLFTDEELVQVATKLVRTKEKLAADGIQFVLFIAPNKERIYSEKMPDYYGDAAEQYRAKQLIDFLRENTDIQVVYPYEALLEEKEKNPEHNIYYRLDTHWNYLGGYIGSRELIKAIDEKVAIPELSETSIEMVEPTICDLANMIHLGPDLNTDRDYIVTEYNQGRLITDKHELTGEFIYHNEDASLGKLFMVRDSFADAMDDFVASRFSQSYMVHYVAYRPEQVAEQKPDIFVYETVERRVGELLDYNIYNTEE